VTGLGAGWEGGGTALGADKVARGESAGTEREREERAARYVRVRVVGRRFPELVSA
jgi:hypothetical protein